MFAGFAVICGGFAEPVSTPAKDGLTVADLRAAAANPSEHCIQAIQHIPVFLIHGDADRCINSNLAKVAYFELCHARGRRTGDLHGGTLKLLILKGIDHRCWSVAYRSRSGVAWLLRRSRGERMRNAAVVRRRPASRTIAAVIAAARSRRTSMVNRPKCPNCRATKHVQKHGSKSGKRWRCLKCKSQEREWTFTVRSEDSL